MQGSSVWRHIVNPFKDIDLALLYMIACPGTRDVEMTYLVGPVSPYLGTEMNLIVQRGVRDSQSRRLATF